MLKIRNGMFETNSSSCHSFIKGNDPNPRIVKDNDLNIILGVGEYGWGYDELNVWLEKADYLAIEAVKDINKLKMLEKAIKRRYPNVTIKYESTGYIDHQSEGVIWSNFKNVADVYDAIFGDSYIIIANDN